MQTGKRLNSVSRAQYFSINQSINISITQYLARYLIVAAILEYFPGLPFKQDTDI